MLELQEDIEGVHAVGRGKQGQAREARPVGSGIGLLEGLEVADEPHCAGGAERALQRAAGLRGDAQRQPVAVRDRDGLDRLAVGHREEELARPVGRALLARELQPGQGESLRLRELYARHDYEVPGAAAYDYVASRSEVDPKKIVVMGYSFGGYYASRIAAFEKRYAGGVAFAALHWDLAGWQREIKRRHEVDPKNTAQSAFHFRWIMGHIDDGDAAIEKAKKFSLVEVAPQINCPFLIVHGSEDKVVPVASSFSSASALCSISMTV